MPETVLPELRLTEEAERLIAVVTADGPADAGISVRRWLLVLLEQHPLLAQVVTSDVIEVAALQHHLQAEVARHADGPLLTVAEVVTRAHAHAVAQGADFISEYDLACVVMQIAGFILTEEEPAGQLHIERDTLYVNFAEGAPPAPPSKTPTLDKLGVDLTQAARDGKLSPVVGRAEEIQLVIETLCRRTKRNPALLGAAGVGKTAIVEGLAQRVVAGQVPAALRGTRLIMLSVSSLVADSKLAGEFEERMQDLIREAGAANVVLFIDEAHAIIGAGPSGRGGNDMANILKPALARGDIACIAATTDEEYRLYIERDGALERRFQPIRVQPLSVAQTLEVLHALRDTLTALRGVLVPDEVLEWICTFADEYLRNRYFPDKAVDILEQCVAYAMTQGYSELTLREAEVIAQRLIGMPLKVPARLQRLRDTLAQRCLLHPDDARALINRLEVTMRGLDLRPARPDVVLLLTGEAAAQSQALAQTIADCVYGDTGRVVSLDLARIVNPAELSLLTGSAPGYVGYSDRVPLHQLAQTPWCVVRLENVHACHPAALEIITQAFREGALTLADGKRVFFSDAVVLLTAQLGAQQHPLGFNCEEGGEHDEMRALAERMLGEEFVGYVDLLCCEHCTDTVAQRQWVRECLLADLVARFRRQGVTVHCDDSVVGWLLAHGEEEYTPCEWERLVDEQVSPVIVHHLNDTPATLTLKADGDRLIVE